MLHDSMKDDMSVILNDFDTRQNRQVKAFALLLIELRGVIEASTSALQLKKITLHRLKKVPYKSLGFLPGVADIRRRLEKVFLNKDYTDMNLILEENTFIREDNILLNQEMRALKKKMENNPPNSSNEWKSLENKINELEKKMEDMAQKNQQLADENKLLSDHVMGLQAENNQLQQALAKSYDKESKLTTLYENELSKNSDLLAEIAELKEQLKQKSLPNSLPEKKFNYQKYFGFQN